MELQYFGANCVKIITKQATLTIDDNLADLGAKSPMKAGDIALYTTSHGTPAVNTKIIIDQPGEYEVSHVSITGLRARAHIDEEGKKTATIYKIAVDDIKILVTGHMYPELTDDQLEAIGLIDVMIVPIGGNGYTLDGIGALKVIKKVEPKLIVPTNYALKGISYPVPQNELADVLKDMSMEAKETVAKLKLKSADIPEITQLVVLERQ
jgi:L-ascorbate metabolism protein UlaG (beta-lactamase superfamily)